MSAEPREVSDTSRTDSAERRQVSVLFCDLVESTRLSRAIDPEDFRELMQRYQHAATETITRDGGIVARYIADGILAYFGYPAAHEDDAEMSVQCGLGLISAVVDLRTPQYPRLNARVGVATGTVVIGDLVSGKLSLEKRAATGEAPYKAARLQTIAQPGSVVVCDVTRRHTGDLLYYDDLGLLELKGFDDPVRAWVAKGKSRVESRFDALRQMSPLTPMVGRRKELTQLDRIWGLVRDSAQGHIVTLRGEPGIGKSRLAREFVAGRSEDANIVRLHCEPQSQNTSLFPVAHLLVSRTGIDRRDPHDTKLDKLDQLFARQHNKSDAVSYIAEILSVPVGGRYSDARQRAEQRKEAALAAIGDYLTALADEQPLLIVFEDLHWADPTTLSLMGRLDQAIRARRILILVTARPEFEPPWAAEQHSVLVELERLDSGETSKIIDAITGGRKLSSRLLKHIMGESEGVPLFAEELTRTVVESSLSPFASRDLEPDEMSLPGSLQGALLARLDRLPEAREIAQIAAVIGRGFSVDLMSSVASVPRAKLRTSLDQLMAAGLINGEAQRDEVLYDFSHALIREAARSTLVRGKRRRLHSRVAEVLEAMEPGLAKTQPEVLAHQLTEAGEGARAIPLWQNAGALAASRAAHVEAARHCQAALKLLLALPDSPDRIQSELNLRLMFAINASASRGYGAPEVEEAYGRAREICRILGNPPELYSVIRGLSTFYIVRDDLEAADELARECLGIGEKTNRPEHIIEGHNALGYVMVHKGELASGRVELQEVVRLYGETHTPGTEYGTEQDPAVAALSLLSHAAWIMGDRQAGLKHRDEALRLADELANPFTIAYANTYAAMFGNIRHDYEDAATHGRRASALATEHGFDVWLATSSMQLALAEGAMGKTKEAIATVSSILAMYQAGGAELTVSYYYSGLADNLRAIGRKKDALDAVEMGIAQAERTGEHFYLSVLLGQRGLLMSELPEGDAKKAEAALLSAIELAKKQGAVEFESRARNWLTALSSPAPSDGTL